MLIHKYYSTVGRKVSAGVTGTGGGAAVEFSLIIVPFACVIFIVFQIALYNFSQQALDYATRFASRQIMIGSVQARGLSADQFKRDVLCPSLRAPLACDKITVSLSPVSKTFDAKAATGIYAFIQQNVPSLNPPNLDTSKGNFCTGAPGDYVFVDVAYNFSLLIDFAKMIGSDQTLNPMILRSTAFIVNEPYQAGSGNTGSGC